MPYTQGSGLSAESRLALVRVKVERAKEHLRDFEAEAERFRDAYTHVIGTDSDATTKRAVSYFRKLPVASFRLVAIAGDVIQNLRSALDHLAFQLVDAAVVSRSGRGLGERRGRRTAFPIAEDSAHYQTLRGQIKLARKPAIKAIDALKPYKGGDPLLWSIHYLNLVDKHRQILPIGPDYLFEGEHFGGRYWRKVNRPLFNGIFGPQVNDDSAIAVKKTLRNIRGVKREQMLKFLRDAVQYVDEIVTSFEVHLYPRRRRT